MVSGENRYPPTNNVSATPVSYTHLDVYKRQCTRYPECKFLIGEVAHKKLTDKQISDLLTKGQTGVIKGFKKKDGGKFDAMLRLENGKIAFAFPPRNQ